MEENRLSGGRGAKCALLSLAVSVWVSLVLLLIFALGLCSAPDPASLAFYFGVGALYAGAVAGGVFCSRRLGAGILSGVLSGGAFCAAVLIVGLIVGGGTMPAWETALLLSGIVVSGAAGAFLGRSRRKKRGPPAGRARRQARKKRYGARRRRHP